MKIFITIVFILAIVINVVAMVMEKVYKKKLMNNAKDKE